MLGFALEFEEEGGGGRKECMGFDREWTHLHGPRQTHPASLDCYRYILRHITIVCSEAQGRSRAVRTLLHNPFVGIILAIKARVETTK
jgi:hypothetical protein